MTATVPSGYDVAEIRAHFPALAIRDDGRSMAFFDGPGGTQVPRAVIEAVTGYYETSNANDGGAFLTSHRSDEMTERAHAGGGRVPQRSDRATRSSSAPT